MGRVTSLRAGTSVLARSTETNRVNPSKRTNCILLVYGIPYGIPYGIRILRTLLCGDIRVHFVIVVIPVVFGVAHFSVDRCLETSRLCLCIYSNAIGDSLFPTSILIVLVLPWSDLNYGFSSIERI